MAYKYKKSGDVVHFTGKAMTMKGEILRIYNEDSLRGAIIEAMHTLKSKNYRKLNVQSVNVKNNHSGKERVYYIDKNTGEIKTAIL